MSPGNIRIRPDLHSGTLTFSNNGENQLLAELHAATAARTRALARISPDQQALFPEGELP
ncbi:hypothetical protein ABTY63_19805 [Streptomyces solisilvae]|uniref:hypothetical protein n=1 Tax=Streptomyces malaysiensis TaxID=92644 RepID=UPI00333400BB